MGEDRQLQAMVALAEERAEAAMEGIRRFAAEIGLDMKHPQVRRAAHAAMTGRTGSPHKPIVEELLRTWAPPEGDSDGKGESRSPDPGSAAEVRTSEGH